MSSWAHKFTFKFTKTVRRTALAGFVFVFAFHLASLIHTMNYQGEYHDPNSCHVCLASHAQKDFEDEIQIALNTHRHEQTLAVDGTAMQSVAISSHKTNLSAFLAPAPTVLGQKEARGSFGGQVNEQEFYARRHAPRAPPQFLNL